MKCAAPYVRFPPIADTGGNRLITDSLSGLSRPRPVETSQWAFRRLVRPAMTPSYCSPKQNYGV